jgi:hypothetical protein
MPHPPRTACAINGSQRDHEVAPLLLGPLAEQSLDAGDDFTELAVIECPDQDHPSVRALRLGPLPRQRREVAPVACDKNSLLLGGELDHQRIVESLKRSVLGEREHVVTGDSQRPADPPWRQVRAQQQPRAALGPEPHERIQLAPLLNRAAALRNRVCDIVGLAVAVGQRGGLPGGR